MSDTELRELERDHAGKPGDKALLERLQAARRRIGLCEMCGTNVADVGNCCHSCIEYTARYVMDVMMRKYRRDYPS